MFVACSQVDCSVIPDGDTELDSVACFCVLFDTIVFEKLVMNFYYRDDKNFNSFYFVA